MLLDRIVRSQVSGFDLPDRSRVLSLFLGGVLVAYSLLPQLASADDRATLVLATTQSPNERVRITEEGKLPAEKPGWFAELSQRAGEDCGANVEFAFMPWKRALQMVEKGEVQAAFSSSFKAERAVYGAYPLKDGKPDENRYAKRIVYTAFVKRGSDNEKLADANDLQGLTVAVERQASIIPELESRGANVYEVADELTMLRMAANGRVDAAVAIEDNAAPFLDQHSDLAELLTQLQPPIQKKVGYVMFSKIFYQDNRALVECFWSTSAELRDTKWFETMRANYN